MTTRQPRRYQVEGAEWMADTSWKYRGRMLCDPVGFGKCLTTLLAMDLRQRNGSEYPVDIVVTTAIARSDWKREAALSFPGLPVTMVAVDQPKHRRKKETPEQFEQRRSEKIRQVLTGNERHLLIASYETADRILDIVEEKGLLLGSFTADEAHALKKQKTLRSQVLRPLIARAERSFLNTGTPIHNKAEDLHNLLDLCALGKFGSKWTFAQKYFRIMQGKFGKTIGPLIDKERLKRDIEGFVLARSVKEAYGELPARIRELVRVPLKGGVHPLSKVAKRALTGNMEVLDSLLREAVASKLDAAADFIAGRDEPTVAYTYTREHARALAAKLQKRGVPATLATGELTPKDRAKVIDLWKAGDGLVLVCTMDAVRESATLTRAAMMVFVDLDYLPGKMLQCEGRIDPARQPEGERRPARYYYFVTEGGIDEVVGERVIEKIRQAAGVIGDDAEAMRLAGTLSPLSVEKVEETPQDAMNDLLARIEARAARLEGLLDGDEGRDDD